MKKFASLKGSITKKLLGVKLLVSLIAMLLFCYHVNGQKADAVTEKKVDYLEKIYFSGLNKEQLNTLILIALQELEAKSPTPSLARQVTFLLGIKEHAAAAKNACEILEMLAAGIYSIDANEAQQQGVLTNSSKKTKEKTFNAIENLGKLKSTAGDLSNNATNLGWSSYYLGSTNFGNGAFKVAGAAANIGNALNSAKDIVKTAGQVRDMIKTIVIFKNKDLPCTDVLAKDIAIGDHENPGKDKTVSPTTMANTSASQAIQTTIIRIPKITTGLLRAFTDSLRNKSGVQSVEKAYDETISTITLIHYGNTDSVADWLEDKFGTQFKLVNFSNEKGNGKINLMPRS